LLKTLARRLEKGFHISPSSPRASRQLASANSDARRPPRCRRAPRARYRHRRQRRHLATLMSESDGSPWFNAVMREASRRASGPLSREALCGLWELHPAKPMFPFTSRCDGDTARLSELSAAAMCDVRWEDGWQPRTGRGRGRCGSLVLRSDSARARSLFFADRA